MVVVGRTSMSWIAPVHCCPSSLIAGMSLLIGNLRGPAVDNVVTREEVCKN